MNVQINHHSIEILQGDITEQDTEAVVNAANNLLWMGGGVAGAIKRKGGAQIETEAIAKGPVGVGEAVVTTAGTLRARHVIHAAVMGQDLHTDAGKITLATSNALRCAEEHRFGSVSFPALGTGVGGFSVFHCAKLMIGAAVDFLQKSEHVKTVRFVLFDRESFNAFTEELKLQFSSKRH